jgi:Flp pilus assembly protein TadB
VIAGVAALSGSLAMVALAAAWVRPVAVVPHRRPRTLVSAGVGRPLATTCPARFREAAARAALPEPHSRWWLASVSVVLSGALAGLVLGGAVFAMLVGSTLAGGIRLALRINRHRAEEHLTRAVPDSLEAIARSARAGSSVVQALAELERHDPSPADRLLAEVARRVDHGDSLADALQRIVAAHPAPAVRLAAAALVVGHETGAPPAKAVEGVAATLRDRAALDREARAHASQARASAVVLLVAPLVFSAFTVTADPRVGDFLFRSWMGWVCLGVGTTLELLGALWMRSIMRSAR